MREPDVPEDDMTPHEFSDDDAEAIISGFAPRDPELGAALDDLRAAFAAVDPPTASGALGEFIVSGADPAPASAGAAAVPTVEALVDDTPTRRHPVLASLSAFAGTALGKICIGASVATAAVGGATVAGVDTPVADLFDDDAVVVTDNDDDTDDLDDDSGDTDTDTDDDTLDTDDTDGDDESEDTDDTAADEEDADDTSDDNDDASDDADDSDESSDETDDASDDADDADESDDADDSGDADDADDNDDTDDSDDSDESDDDADADDADDSDDDSPTSTSTTVPVATTASATHSVDGVGTVSFTYDSGVWTLISATPAPGWSLDEAGIDDDGVDVRFVNGPIEVDVDTEVEDGQVRLRVRTDNDDTDERTESFFWYPLS